MKSPKLMLFSSKSYIIIYMNKAPEKKTIKDFFKYQILLITGIIPTWLAAWPGFFCYDAETEVYEVMTYKYSNHHPIVHELLLGNLFRIGYRINGSYNTGLILFLIFQVIIMTAIFAYMLLTLKQCKVRKSLILLSGIFLSLFPPVSIYLVCSAKDVLFSGGVVLLFTMFFRIEKGLSSLKSKQTLALILAGTLLTCFFRNNGLYALVLFALILFFFFKNYRKALIPVVAGLVIYVVVTQTLIAVLPAKKGELKEFLSVPMQQLARVYNEDRDAYSEEDLATLYDLIPAVILERYDKDCADDVKVNFLEDNFKADKGRFISLYVRTFFKSPAEYFKAFWYMIDSYILPWVPVTGYEGNQVGQMVYGESAYFQHEIENPCTAHSLFPAYNRFLRSMSLDIKWQKVPVLSFILSPAFYLWICLAAFILQIIRKKKDRMLRYFIPLPIFLTVLLGPMALVRYVFYLFLLCPLFIHDMK